MINLIIEIIAVISAINIVDALDKSQGDPRGIGISIRYEFKKL